MDGEKIYPRTDPTPLETCDYLWCYVFDLYKQVRNLTKVIKVKQIQLCGLLTVDMLLKYVLPLNFIVLQHRMYCDNQSLHFQNFVKFFQKNILVFFVINIEIMIN